MVPGFVVQGLLQPVHNLKSDSERSFSNLKRATHQGMYRPLLFFRKRQGKGVSSLHPYRKETQDDEKNKGFYAD